MPALPPDAFATIVAIGAWFKFGFKFGFEFGFWPSPWQQEQVLLAIVALEVGACILAGSLWTTERNQTAQLRHLFALTAKSGLRTPMALPPHERVNRIWLYNGMPWALTAMALVLVLGDVAQRVGWRMDATSSRLSALWPAALVALLLAGGGFAIGLLYVHHRRENRALRLALKRRGFVDTDVLEPTLAGIEDASSMRSDESAHGIATPRQPTTMAAALAIAQSPAVPDRGQMHGAIGAWLVAALASASTYIYFGDDMSASPENRPMLAGAHAERGPRPADPATTRQAGILGSPAPTVDAPTNEPAAHPRLPPILSQEPVHKPEEAPDPGDTSDAGSRVAARSSSSVDEGIARERDDEDRDVLESRVDADKVSQANAVADRVLRKPKVSGSSSRDHAHAIEDAMTDALVEAQYRKHLAKRTQSQDADLPELRPSPATRNEPPSHGHNSGTDAGASIRRDKLSIAEIKDTLSQIQAHVSQCGVTAGAIAGTRIQVHITVQGGSGSVHKATPLGEHANTSVGKCVANAARRARFEQFSDASMAFVYAFRI